MAATSEQTRTATRIAKPSTQAAQLGVPTAFSSVCAKSRLMTMESTAQHMRMTSVVSPRAATNRPHQAASAAATGGRLASGSVRPEASPALLERGRREALRRVGVERSEQPVLAAPAPEEVEVLEARVSLLPEPDDFLESGQFAQLQVRLQVAHPKARN